MSHNRKLAALEQGFADGNYQQALTDLAELQITRSRSIEKYVPAWQIATLFTRAGKNEEALDWLEKAYAEHDPICPILLLIPSSTI
jgi:hypothetical protein